MYESITLERKDFEIERPTFIVIAGASGGGKTTLAGRILLERRRIFRNGDRFASVTVAYKHPQPIYESLERQLRTDEGVETIFTREFRPSLLDNVKRPAVFLLDDYDDEAFSSEKILDYAKGKSHHSDLTLIIITQSLYHHQRSAKYASEIFKQAKGFFVCALVREKYGLAILGGQLNVGTTRKFLLSAYERSVEKSPVRAKFAPAHLFINFGLNVREELRCVGNFIRNEASKKEDIRTRALWVFRESTEMEGKKNGSARLYYLLSEDQLESLTTTPNDKKIERGADGGDENWTQFFSSVLPAGLSKFPSETRKKATQLARYMQQRGGILTDDGELEFPGSTDSVETASDAMGVILYFVVPPLDGGRNVAQPRCLFDLALWLRSAPKHLFDRRRVPHRILGAMRSFYRGNDVH